jgi:outer membrane receptor protein involved in Fe transport
MDNAYLARHDTNGFDETTLRANLVFEPTDTASYSFTALGFDSDNGYDAFSLDNTRVTLSDEPGRDAQRSAGLAARGSWQLGSDSSLEAVATWLDSDLEYGFDEDWTYVGICDGTLCDPVADFYSNTDSYARKRKEVTADLRWLADKTAPNGRSRRYVLGFYAQQRDEDLARNYYGDFASAYATERRALYGQAELGLTDRLGLTLGLRYERFDDNYADSFGFGSGNEDELHNGEVTLEYALANEAFVYATVSRGDKAGGVNTEASANLPFMQPIFQSFLTPRLRIGSESLINRELGFKARFADGRLRFSSALFRMRRDNAQLESWVWDAQNFLWIGFLDNADGSNEGLEAELSFSVNERWELGAGIGLLETQIDELMTFDLDLGQFVARRDIEQAKAPSWQFNFRARWRPSERWLAEIDVEGHDGSRFGYYHDRMLPRRTVVGASLRRSFGRAELSLWARNLTDEDVPVHGLYFGNDPRKGWINESYYQFGEPRVLGLGLRYSF